MDSLTAISDLHKELHEKLKVVHETITDPRDRAVTSLQLVHNYNKVICMILVPPDLPVKF